MTAQDYPMLSSRDVGFLREKFHDPSEIEDAMKRLAGREPLAYILGEWYFYDEVYRVSPDCLIPRPETEHLVDELIRRLPVGGRFADLCTGSGCIAISILAHRPDCTAVAADISEGALKLAAKNAELNKVSDRITFRRADLLTENPLGEERFDILVSNPPYICSDVIDTLEPEVLSEPRIALDGGQDGLDFYRLLLTAYLKNIKEGGYLICEIGYDQGDALRKLCDCEIKKDYSGNDRVMIRKV